MTARNVQIYERLKEARAHLGLTQAGMAAQMSVSLRAYQTYEANESQPKAADVAGLAAAGIDLNWLLTGGCQMLRASSTTCAPVVDEQLLAETLRLVDDWLAAHRRTMTAARKAEVSASIYAMALEDAAEGRTALDAKRIAHILKLAG